MDFWINNSADNHEAGPAVATQTSRAQLEVGGVWTIDNLVELDKSLNEMHHSLGTIQQIEASGVTQLDTCGAMLLLRASHASAGGTISGLPPSFRTLLRRIARLQPVEGGLVATKPRRLTDFVERTGKASIEVADTAGRFVAFIGRTLVTGLTMLVKPSRWRITALVHHMEATGINALPIVGLISFLIGIVLAYQGATQLRTFGAEVFTVDLIAISVLRELGILLAAIVIAGRTASAFTAQIGSMRVNEEIDALATMGISAFEVLVMPRVLALLLTLPLLALFADFMGLLGGAVMAYVVLDISPQVFIGRLHDAISPSTFWVGIAKAPVFGLVIGLVGCFEGLQVRHSAESVGEHTTKAVVESIFLIIVLDALFSIVFGMIGW